MWYNTDIEGSKEPDNSKFVKETTMRAPFQILAIPYRLKPHLQYCVLHRSDIDQYQFVAGGGEDDEKPIDAAAREIYEETSVKAVNILPLTSMAYIPANVTFTLPRQKRPLA